MPEQLTHYGSSSSIYAHRTAIALLEAKAEYTHYEVDFKNKPDWFVNINPAGKVPAITYGGPKVAPDAPSPESTKLAESAVLLEFIADLYPSSGLMPLDPIQRAKARFIINLVDTVLFPAMLAWMIQGGSAEGVAGALKTLQAHLPEAGRGKYAVNGDFTIADAALAPFYARILMIAERGLHKKGKEYASDILVALARPEFSKVKEYGERLLARPSVYESWDEDKTLAYMTKAIMG
ncbi:hypothetical protein CONPUDRAFT_138172 [Coniophora puteana RWD-64-598 SS2]|uniref:Thioredoxin-like protein n=1 Tax=Coniophora puteana (strain RWD-64-598) TaxID=741705 RepID=A0A5M3MIK7_CONPW|nr:uncharacterized protein CONPUDRAFT_138172 [Coniophora puteana RWD-64-598 SS2]EIW78846.1 hypothetical protein CONPUDRAFT_138172 [Coniophora puteana RWD-64-598 SS2]